MFMVLTPRVTADSGSKETMHQPQTESKPNSDKTTSIQELKSLVSEFVNERNWQNFHTPRNLAVSVTLEASELLEHFQWAPPGDESIDQHKFQQISEELSDVMAYLLSLANVLNIDVASSMRAKMQKNRQKYPVDANLGTWKKVKA
ncbi:MAG: nucleotide pyrophosphohydrolase [Candidatus Riflebacteria bacterium]|nr:nucleotide pyrophosphohydrolase [Candidatus Riflebacteria bacterium]